MRASRVSGVCVACAWCVRGACVVRAWCVRGDLFFVFCYFFIIFR